MQQEHIIELLKLFFEHLKDISKLFDFIKKYIREIIIVSLIMVISITTYYCGKQIFEQKEVLRLTSGPVGGTFSDFSYILKKSLFDKNIAIVDENSEGSIENIERLSGLNEKFDLGLAHNGIKEPKGVDFKKIKAIAHIYDSLLFVAIRHDTYNKIRYIEDISEYRNLKIYAGGDKSGTRSVFNEIFPQNSNDIASFKELSFADAANMLVDKIDVCFFLVERNSKLVEKLYNKGNKIRFIGFRNINYIDELVIKSGKKLQNDHYLDNNRQIISTIGTKEFLLARSSVPEEVIYKIVKYIYGDAEITRKFQSLSPDWFVVHKNNDISLIDYDYHDGAIRYYNESIKND